MSESVTEIMLSMLEAIRSELSAGGSAETAKSSQHAFKDEIKTYGLKVPETHRLAKRFLKEIRAGGLTKSEVFWLCGALWASGYQEEAIIACDFAGAERKQFAVEDFDIFADWVNRHVSNWATCDAFCNHTVGDLLTDYPELVPRLMEWAVSENRWMKRAAAVSLIIPAKRGLFHSQVFLIADVLLEDRDDMVQKGYGWMLKETAESGLEAERAVFDYVMQRKAIMPRTALRYAIEKMPRELREQAMSR